MARLNSLVFAALVYLLLPSHVLQGALGLRINEVYAACLALMLVAILFSRNMVAANISIAGVLALLVALAALASILSSTNSQILMGVSLAATLFVVVHGWSALTSRDALKLFNILCITILAGGAISVFYGLLGGQPLYELDLTGYRVLHLYLTSFSDAVVGDIVRPAGIFDEPGALAMYATAVLCLNEIRGVDKRINLLILALSAFTGSLMMYIIIFLYLLMGGETRDILKKAIFVLAMAGTLIYFADNRKAKDYLETVLIGRVEMNNDGLSGDNRSNQVKSFLQLVDWRITLEGQKRSGVTHDGHDLSSNPFSIYYYYGLVIWLPYLLCMLWLAYVMVTANGGVRFAAIAMFGTLLQRPFLYSMHWTLLLCVVLVGIHQGTKAARCRGFA